MSPDDPTRIFALHGRVAVVTGASSGMGVAMAEGLAAAGARVVLAARRTDRLEAVREKIRAAGGEAIAVPCDVADAAAVDALAAETLARWNQVDVLVNNAGFVDVVRAQDEPLDTFQAVLDVNLTGAFRCARRFGREMLARGSGSIVNVSSILGIVGSGQVPQASYAASKGGLIALTRELAAQWARKGIRVNALAPSWFPTEMNEEMFASEKAQRWMRDRTPLGRTGELHELIGPLLFLASDASSYVTGHTLAVDGGWTII